MPDVLDRLQSALANRYLLERELGRGGMATVYLAHDLKHARRVALKVHQERSDGLVYLKVGPTSVRRIPGSMDQ